MTAAEIKALRAKACMTQAELATFCNTTSNTVSRWERGGHAPDKRAMARLKTLLGRVNLNG